jgi:hypothetical protein
MSTSSRAKLSPNSTATTWSTDNETNSGGSGLVKSENMPRDSKRNQNDTICPVPSPISRSSSKSSNMKRKGKWTAEEEVYTRELIHHFKLGILPVMEGKSLRAFLSEQLNCDPMRITKKVRLAKICWVFLHLTLSLFGISIVWQRKGDASPFRLYKVPILFATQVLS